jgi:hypothetical protein
MVMEFSERKSGRRFRFHFTSAEVLSEFDCGYDGILQYRL